MKKIAVDSAFLAPQRESSRRTAVEIRKQVQDRAKESEQRKVRGSCLESSFRDCSSPVATFP